MDVTLFLQLLQSPAEFEEPYFPYNMYSLVRFVRNLTIHGPEHVRRGLFSSLSDIYNLVLATFPWLVVELWICDMKFGGVYAAASKDSIGTHFHRLPSGRH